MTPAELRAILNVSDEVAIYPSPVSYDMPGWLGQRNQRKQIICPRHLVRARVIADGHHWQETRTISACGDKDYKVDRRNGVLVEFDLPDGPIQPGGNELWAGTKLTPAKLRRLPHTKVVKVTTAGAEKKVVQMVIGRKAVFAAWGEYELEEAKKEKAEEQKRLAYERLHAACDALGVKHDDGQYRTRWDDEKKKNVRYGIVVVSLERAEELAKLLAA